MVSEVCKIVIRSVKKTLDGNVMTRNQLRVAIECHKGVKVKVVKWC